MPDLVWYIANMVGVTIKLSFVFSGVWLQMRRHLGKDSSDTVRWVYRWSKRFYPAGAVAYWLGEAVVNGPLNGWDALFILLDWWNWRGLKDENDDDFWKRAKDKVTDVVRQVGSRLVVQPATSGA